MKNCAVAEWGSDVRAMAIVPVVFFSPFEASLRTGLRVAFCLKSGSNPPPWIMNPGITRWNRVPS
ncbi:hypothetical protein D3C83_48240 [compost metagenome]